jgi:hypothetical protein
LCWQVGLIKEYTILFDLNENDWSASTDKTIERFLKNGSEFILTIYYDEDTLSACLGFPEVRIVDLTYFVRLENNVPLNPNNFLEKVMFGTLDSYPEESALRLLSGVYAPYIYHLNCPDGILKKTIIVNQHIIN